MIIVGIIALNVVVSIFCFYNKEGFDKLCLIPKLIHKDNSEMYRLVSHAFIHADIGHLIFNMLTLFFFGREVENRILSSTELMIFYLLAILSSALPAYQKNKINAHYKAVGASGAVSAVMFVLVLFQPWSVIYIKFIIPIYFILFAVGYIMYSYYQSLRSNDNIAHDVHLWGAMFAIAYMFLIHPSSLSTFLNAIVNAPFL